LGQQSEDLSILYSGGVLASIDGLSLSTILQSFFLQMDKSYKSSLNTNLAFQKWELGGQSLISDAITVGVNVPFSFGLRSKPPQNCSTIVAVGKQPMIACYFSDLVLSNITF
jgi:hypothetical protein